MTPPRWWGWGIAIAIGTPGAAVGQGDVPCEAVLDHADQARERSFSQGRRQQFAWGDVRARCAGQETSMRADSIAWFEWRNQFELHRDVRFRDTTVTLDADRAVYYLDDERLEAFGNVRLVNLTNGTVLTGPALTYWRRVPALRDTTVLRATGRPTVEYPVTGAPDDPYVITGRTIVLRGERDAWAGGGVRIDRREFHAEGDSAELDLEANAGVLRGAARVNGGQGDDAFSLWGRTVAFTSADQALDWVQARDSATAQSEEFTLTGDTVEFSVVENQIQSGRAWGDSTRAVATSAQNRIVADSLAIDAPAQVLEELRGFRAARATSWRDSLDTDGDWIAGDTLVARFGMAELQPRRILRTLVATGHALALYRVFRTMGAEPDINYSRGNTITATFTDVGLTRVQVVGNADGVHLEAPRRRPEVGRRERP